MDNKHEKLRKEFSRLLSMAVEAGLDKIEPFVGKTEISGTYPGWSKVINGNLGFPIFLKSYMQGPIDYKNAFLPTKPEEPPLVQMFGIKEFDRLIKFCTDESIVQEKLLGKKLSEYRDINDYKFFENYLCSNIMIVIWETIDRFLHLYGNCDSNKFDLGIIVEEFVNSVFDDYIYVDYYIPILYCKFGFDDLEISDDLKITKMDDKTQIARAILINLEQGIIKEVASSATHALVIKNKKLKSLGWFDIPNVISDIKNYPMEEIEGFMASMRIVSGADFGYIQLLMKPRGWVFHYRSDLPTLEGICVKSYPKYFDTQLWQISKIPIINEKTAIRIGNICKKLNKVNNNKLKLAIRRINHCFLRDEDEDKIIDAVIGLEALLGDRGGGITYKISMRAGVLSKKLDSFTENASDICKYVKRLYDIRSQIVHGVYRSKINEIEIEENKRIRASDLAIRYLGYFIQIMLDNDEFLKIENIDRELLSSDIQEFKSQTS